MILEEITDWATQNENVIALIATGSQARKQVDEFSDYDIEIIARNSKELTETNKWFSKFGKVVVFQSFDEGQDYPTRLVVYEDGTKVDFTLADESRINKMKNKLDDLYDRGYKVLLDKTGITKELPQPTKRAIHKLPSKEEYLETVSEFWFEASHIPKYLLREDLWVVKFRDWTMKELLLRMLEWYTLSKNPNSDVWHIGIKMKDWLEPEMWKELDTIFAHFDVQDSWSGLLAEIGLFRRVSRAVANKLGFEYPEEMDKTISEYILNQKNRMMQRGPDIHNSQHFSY